MTNGTSVNKISPTITVSALATINPKSKAAKNFTDPVERAWNYRVRADEYGHHFATYEKYSRKANCHFGLG